MCLKNMHSNFGGILLLCMSITSILKLELLAFIIAYILQHVWSFYSEKKNMSEGVITHCSFLYSVPIYWATSMSCMESNRWEIHYFNYSCSKTWNPFICVSPRVKVKILKMTYEAITVWNEELLQFGVEEYRNWLYFEKITISHYENHLGGCWNNSDKR